MAELRSQTHRNRAIARALDAAADQLEREAEALRRCAQGARAAAELHAHLDKITAAIAQIGRDLDAGLDLAAVLRHWAEHLELPEAMLRAHWFASRETNKRLSRAARDREICRLAWKGWANAELAARFHLHPKSVSRIIARRLRAGRRGSIANFVGHSTLNDQQILPPRLDKPKSD